MPDRKALFESFEDNEWVDVGIDGDSDEEFDQIQEEPKEEDEEIVEEDSNL